MFSARQFAIMVHGSQKYGTLPYIDHLGDVAMIVTGWCLENDPLIGANLLGIIQDSAWLHDVLEDTDCSFEFLYREFGQDVATIVWLVTDPYGENREERKENLYKKIKSAVIDFNENLVNWACLVKAADRLANVRSGKKNNMYKMEHEKFKKVFYRKEFDSIWKEIEEILGYNNN
jgi:guanosine-3',5'-bis(diphosphate) 3'-pyrophosphohydrolase